MQTLDLTFPDPARNLACDEALLDLCEKTGSEGLLRFWEPPAPFVVLGYSNAARTEVSLDACRELGIPVHRRISGGGTVLQGPGCLNYSLVLPFSAGGSTVHATNTLVMEKNRAALMDVSGRAVRVEGHTDLCVGGLKFSGNAQRRKRTHLLFHGTFLIAFDLTLVDKCLPMPSTEPAYRKKRPHADFIMNLDVDPEKVKRAMADVWGATKAELAVPEEEIGRLARDIYDDPAWTLKF